MVIESTIEEIANVDNRDESEAYKVHLEVGNAEHRILTIKTENDEIASEWTKDVLKSYPGHIVAGICFLKVDSFSYMSKRMRKCKYFRYREDFSDIIQICVGSHCLIYESMSKSCGKFLNKFFGDYFVETVGMDMANVAKTLKEKYGIAVKNPIDLQTLVTKKKEDLYHYDLYKYSLDQLACAVLGKEYDVVRPEQEIELIYPCYYMMNDEEVSDKDKVKFSTIDAYLCYMIGEELVYEEDFESK